jgi:hypothetical protein
VDGRSPGGRRHGRILCCGPRRVAGLLSSHTLIAGNYFHGNDTGIMAPDGTDHERIQGNVFVNSPDAYPWAIVLGSDVGSTVAHNTLTDAPRITT